MAWYVYVLQNPLGIQYVGMTTNIDDRMMRHNRSRSGFTAHKGPWKLVYSKRCVSSTVARKNEKYLKGGAGRAFLKTELARMAKLADAHA